MKHKSDVNNKAWIMVFALMVLFVIIIIVLINIAKPKETLLEVEATPTATVKPTATPAAKASHEPEEINGVIWIEATEWLNRYKPYFDDGRTSNDILTMRVYKADINTDGMAEIYVLSKETINRSTSYTIECYDFATETYSKLLSPKNIDYFLIAAEDTVYFMAFYDDLVTDEKTYTYHQPFLNDGQLRIEEVDDAAMSQIRQYMIRTNLERMYGNDILFTVNIMVYDISNNEVLIREHAYEIEGITDEIVMYFGSVNSDYHGEIEHTYKADIFIDYEDQDADTTFYFGDSKYLTTYDNDTMYHSINEELRTFLISLAENTYEDED